MKDDPSSEEPVHIDSLSENFLKDNSIHGIASM